MESTTRKARQMFSQEDFIARMAREYNSIQVKDGYDDGSIRVTASSGQIWRVDEDGIPTEMGCSFHIRPVDNDGRPFYTGVSA